MFLSTKSTSPRTSPTETIPICVKWYVRDILRRKRWKPSIFLSDLFYSSKWHSAFWIFAWPQNRLLNLVKLALKNHQNGFRGLFSSRAVWKSSWDIAKAFIVNYFDFATFDEVYMGNWLSWLKYSFTSCLFHKTHISEQSWNAMEWPGAQHWDRLQKIHFFFILPLIMLSWKYIKQLFETFLLPRTLW